MTGDDTVRLTYAELAEARGVSLGAARRMVHRHKWPKQVGNDRLSRIAVPAEFVTRSVDADVINVAMDDVAMDIARDVMQDVTTDAAEVQVVDFDEAVAAFAKITKDAISDVTKDVIATLQEAVTTLRDELYTERVRAERAEQELREMRDELATRRWWRWR